MPSSISFRHLTFVKLPRDTKKFQDSDVEEMDLVASELSKSDRQLRELSKVTVPHVLAAKEDLIRSFMVTPFLLFF